MDHSSSVREITFSPLSLVVQISDSGLNLLFAMYSAVFSISRSLPKKSVLLEESPEILLKSLERKVVRSYPISSADEPPELLGISPKREGIGLCVPPPATCPAVPSCAKF